MSDPPDTEPRSSLPRVPVTLSPTERRAAGRAATRAGLPLASWIGSLVVTELHAKGFLHDGKLVDP